MKTKSKIQKHYHDALYWASSNQTEKLGYHLTRTEEAILRKLIHYSTKNPKISYSNKVISQHTFIGEESLRKYIPKIAKKGFISTDNHKIFDGEFKERRTIYIKWDFIEKILSKVPKPEQHPKDEDKLSNDEPVIDSMELVDEMEAISIPEANQEVIEPSSTSTLDKKHLDFKSTTSIYPIPDVIITDEKLNFLKSLVKNPDLAKEEVESWGQTQLKNLFYGNKGTWLINDTSMENQYLIKYVHHGGSRFHLYNKNQSNDSIEISVDDFGYTLEQRGIDFGQVTPELYANIKSYGLLKCPVEH